MGAQASGSQETVPGSAAQEEKNEKKKGLPTLIKVLFSNNETFWMSDTSILCTLSDLHWDHEFHTSK